MEHALLEFVFHALVGSTCACLAPGALVAGVLGWRLVVLRRFLARAAEAGALRAGASPFAGEPWFEMRAAGREIRVTAARGAGSRPWYWDIRSSANGAYPALHVSRRGHRSRSTLAEVATHEPSFDATFAVRTTDAERAGRLVTRPTVREALADALRTGRDSVALSETGALAAELDRNGLDFDEALRAYTRAVAFLRAVEG